MEAHAKILSVTHSLKHQETNIIILNPRRLLVSKKIAEMIFEVCYLVIFGFVQNDLPVYITGNKILAIRRETAVSDGAQVLQCCLLSQVGSAQRIDVHL
jgi:hypothetical protein